MVKIVFAGVYIKKSQKLILTRVDEKEYHEKILKLASNITLNDGEVKILHNKE
jgi:hypothetical protein